jgi:hypothetical protein
MHLKELVDELVNVVPNSIPLTVGVLPRQQLPFPTVLGSVGLYSTPLQLHPKLEAVQLPHGKRDELLAVVSVQSVEVTVNCQEVQGSKPG